MNHTGMCRVLRHSDAAKRISAEYEMHRCAQGQAAIGRWLAFAMDDGTSDHTLYDSKRDAVRHQHHDEAVTVFVQITPAGMPVCDAEALLSIHRKMYDSGVRLTDRDAPTGGRDAIRRLTAEDMRAQLRTIRTGGRTKPSNLKLGRN